MTTQAKQTKKLGTREAWKIAMEASADPRSVNRVLAGKSVRGPAAERIRRALAAAGLALVLLMAADCASNAPDAPLTVANQQDAQVQQTPDSGAPGAPPDALVVVPDAMPNYLLPVCGPTDCGMKIDLLAGTAADCGACPPDAGSTPDVLPTMSDAKTPVVPDALALGPPDATPYVHIIGIQPGKCDHVTIVGRADRLGWTVTNTSADDIKTFADAGWPLTGIVLGPSARVSWTTGPTPTTSVDISASAMCSYNTEKTECKVGQRLDAGYPAGNIAASCDIFKILISPVPAGQTQLIVDIVCDIGWGLDGVLRDGTSETRILDMTHTNAGCAP